MRSHPYTPPPPLAPLLDDLSTYMPNRSRRVSADLDTPLSDLDPDTSRLLPQKRRQHRVRVQGRLALVRSVSVANLKAPSGGDVTPPPVPVRHDSGVGGSTTTRRSGRRRRRSLDGNTSETDEEDDDNDVEERDTQLRGYGIGGAGNIRRPTDVIGSSTRGSSSFTSLFSSFSSSAPSTPRDFIHADTKSWNFRGFLGRIGDRKGKGRVAT